MPRAQRPPLLPARSAATPRSRPARGAHARARRIQRFLSQPFFVAEAFTGTPGKYVKLEDTVKSFKRIVDGEFDDLPEQAFYMRGGIEEVLEAAEKMKAQG